MSSEKVSRGRNGVSSPSSAGFRLHPANRDHPLKTAAMWIQGKKIVDNYGSLWRIHDKLYDFTDFLYRHPGGEVWLQVTQGTDITEAFESAHLNPAVEKLLDKYYVKKATDPRNSPYTFEEGGFYKVLRQRVYLKLKELELDKITWHPSVAAVQNFLLLSFFAFFCLAAVHRSYPFAVLAGLFLGLNVNCAHNFYHLRNNWRMYAWDLGLLSSYEWRITHALSHHLYTNSIYDFELIDFEPVFDFKVTKSKTWLQRFGAIPAYFILPFAFFFMEFIKRVIAIYTGIQKPRPENFLPLVEFLALFGITGELGLSFKLWLVIHSCSSFYFGTVGVIAAHHHPDIYHEGDQFKYGTDWGLCQLDAVRDRRDVNGILIAELTMYGQHALHHLFPTLDHGKLRAVETVLYDTCKEFGIDDFVYVSSPYTQWDHFIGMFQQLARTEPRSFD